MCKKSYVFLNILMIGCICVSVAQAESVKERLRKARMKEQAAQSSNSENAEEYKGYYPKTEILEERDKHEYQEAEQLMEQIELFSGEVMQHDLEVWAEQLGRTGKTDQANRIYELLDQKDQMSPLEFKEQLNTLTLEIGNSFVSSSQYSPSVNKSQLAQSLLRSLSTATETYAVGNKGIYPTSSEPLTTAIPPYINASSVLCGEEHKGYYYECSFSSHGYEFTAKPIDPEVGTTTYRITTGGILTP